MPIRVMAPIFLCMTYGCAAFLTCVVILAFPDIETAWHKHDLARMFLSVVGLPSLFTALPVYMESEIRRMQCDAKH